MNKIGLNFEHVVFAASENNLSVAEVLKNVKNLGVETLDVRYERFIDGSTTYSDIISSHLEIGSVFTMCDLGHSVNIGKEITLVDFCKRNRVKTIMLLTEPYRDDDDKEAYYKLLCQNLRRIIKYAATFNIDVAIENFGKEGSPFAKSEDLEMLFKTVKGLKLIFDASNFMLAGENVLDMADKFMPYIVRLHVKDRTYTYNADDYVNVTMDGKESWNTVVGEGDCKIYELIDNVVGVYANMPIVMEFFFTQRNIMNYIEKSAVNLAEKLK